MLVVVLILLSINYGICVIPQYIASTAQGKIRGILRDGYVSYNGIPYASVSDPDGRFKRATLAPFWSGIREPHESNCSSSSVIEECLQLDVHTPIGVALPVLVWVTGGSGRYNPTKLVQEGIITVIVRHRLGPQGFLCSNEENIPGNAGLKDVVLALRWVRDNIVAFNGNPNKVVVAGQSFGAAMVESLTLTTTAHGLYQGVILQSGTILAPWAFNFDAEERAKVLKTKFNGSGDVAVLTDISAANLTAKAGELALPYLPFAICAERPFRSEERLIAEAPPETLARGVTTTVPMIIGYANNEGYIFASVLKESRVLRRMSKGVSFLLPIELQTTTRDVSKMVTQINEMYFENNTTMAAVLAYHRDAYFLSHIHRSVRFHATALHPVYYYQFSYSGSIGIEQEPGIRKSGAAHSDELGYLFPHQERELNGNDAVVQENLVRLWTNFVKHLNPNSAKVQDIIWNPCNLLDPELLDINTKLEMIKFPFKKEMQKWEDIYETIY